MCANKYCRKFEMQRVNVWWIWFIHATTFGGESKHLHPETLSFRCISCGFPISKLNIVTYSQLESNLSLGSVDSNVLSATASCFQQRTSARAMIYGTYRNFQSPSLIGVAVATRWSRIIGSFIIFRENLSPSFNSKGRGSAANLEIILWDLGSGTLPHTSLRHLKESSKKLSNRRSPFMFFFSNAIQALKIYIDNALGTKERNKVHTVPPQHNNTHKLRWSPSR